MSTTTKEGPITQATLKAANKADDLLEKGKEAKDAAKENVKKHAAAVKEKAVEAHDNARTFVQENPEKSIGIAVGVGAVIGVVIALLVTRRR